MVSARSLILIAGWGGVVVGSTGFFMQKHFVDKTRSADYYKLALKTLRTHAGAVQYLGEPIKDKRFKLSDTENLCDGKTARFSFPVYGPKDKATYYFWAEKSNDKWVINRAELELKSQPDARLVIVKQKN